MQAAPAEGSCLPMNAWPREGTGWGWLSGNGLPWGSLWVGWGGFHGDPGGVGLSPQAHAGSELAMRAPACARACVGAGSTQARRHQPVDCPVWGRGKGGMVVVPPALTLGPHNTVFPRMFLVPPELLALCQHPG